MFFHSRIVGAFGVFAMSVLLTSPVWAQIDQEIREKFGEGQALINEGEFEEAAKIYRELTESHEDLVAAWFFLGYATHMKGDIAEALEIHKKVADLDDDEFSHVATYNVACANALLGNKDEAISALEKAVEMGFDRIDEIEIDSDLYSLHTDVRFARILANLDNDEEIAEKMDQAEQHLGSGDFAGAAEVYKSILEEDKRNPFATYRLGFSLHGAGELDQALEMHTKATRFDGVAPIATYNIACVHALRDNKDEAFKHLEKSVEMGFLRPDALAEDPDLNNLRDDDRFTELSAKVDKLYQEKQDKNKKVETKEK